LGVSRRTVWRRVKAGKLSIDRSVTPRLVRVSGGVSVKTVPESAKVSEVSGLKAEVTRLEAVLAEVREALEDAKSERDSWRRAMAEYMAQTRFLLEAGEQGEEEEEAVDAEERERVGVFSRLRQWFGGGR
jgi:hypothetical protein